MKTWAVYFEQPMPYRQTAELQERLVAARLREEIPDTILFLEHLPVITLGRRGRDRHLLASRKQLEKKGIALELAPRGGDVTYHGPGQLVIYPILRLRPSDSGAHGYLYNLEEIALRTARDFNVRAYRRPGMNGVWCDRGKIAAIGFRLQHWISSHGMSFNVNTDLGGFENIVACGLVGESVASLETILGTDCPPLPHVRRSMCRHAAEVLDRKLETIPPARLRRTLDLIQNGGRRRSQSVPQPPASLQLLRS